MGGMGGLLFIKKVGGERDSIISRVGFGWENSQKRMLKSQR